MISPQNKTSKKSGMNLHIGPLAGKPAVSHALVRRNREIGPARGHAGGIMVTPSHSPPHDGSLLPSDSP